MPVRADKDRFHLLRTCMFGQPLELLYASYHTHVFPRHWNETYVIQLVEQGVNEFYCRGRMQHAAAGDLVLLHPQEVHTGRSISTEPLAYRTFYPSAELFEEMHAHFTGLRSAVPSFPHPVVVRDTAFAPLLRTAFEIFTGRATQFARESVLVELLGALMQRHAVPNTPGTNSRREVDAVRRAKNYLEDHIEQKPSLAELAKLARISTFHLAHVFRKTLGIAPHEYLLNLRIARAKELLRRGHTIADVAHRTGFVDQSHFSKRFKRLVGVTPGQYLHWCYF